MGSKEDFLSCASFFLSFLLGILNSFWRSHVLILVHQTHILSKANLRGHLLIHIQDNLEIKLTIARQQLYHTEWIVHKIPQTRSDGWGRGGRGKMLDLKTQGLEFNPQNSHYKSDCGMCPCNPSIRKLKGGVGRGGRGALGALWTVSLPYLASFWPLSDLVSKECLRNYNNRDCPLVSMYTSVRTHTQILTYTQYTHPYAHVHREIS